MAIVKFFPRQSITDHAKQDSHHSPFYYYINHGDFGIVWFNVATFIVAHVLFFRFLYELELKHAYTFMFSEYTSAFCVLTRVPAANSMSLVIGLAVATGVHMYYSHKAFKATLPLQVFLMLGQVLTGQVSNKEPVMN